MTLNKNYQKLENYSWYTLYTICVYGINIQYVFFSLFNRQQIRLCHTTCIVYVYCIGIKLITHMAQNIVLSTIVDHELMLFLFKSILLQCNDTHDEIIYHS